jgi:hypothetical protein
MKIRAIRISMLCAMLVALVMASTASAQSSPDQTVYNPNGEVLNVVSGGGPEDNAQPPSAVADTGNTTTPVQQGTTPSATNQLPFTGFQAGLVGVAGLALLGTGFAMRRFAKHDS